MTAGIDTQAVLAELEPAWLDGLEGDERDEGRRLLEAVVDDWADEAAATPDPAAVLRYQKQDLEALRDGRDAAGRLEALREHAAARRVDRLNARTYALGMAILHGSVDEAKARREGHELLREAEELAGAVEAEPVRRKLDEAVMEALYAVERKAMSARLAREAGDAAGGPGPPDVR